jgi:hypothetical protein
VAESCTICSSRSRRPVRKLLGYTLVCCSFIEKDQGVEGKKNSYPVSRHHGKWSGRFRNPAGRKGPGWTPQPVWTRWQRHNTSMSLPGIELSRPTRSQSLYWLSHPSQLINPDSNLSLLPKWILEWSEHVLDYTRMYPKSSRTGRLERELQMVQLSAIRCSRIAILWVSLISFAATTLCVASQRVIPTVSVYFVISTQSGHFWIHPRMSHSLYSSICFRILDADTTVTVAHWDRNLSKSAKTFSITATAHKGRKFHPGHDPTSHFLKIQSNIILPFLLGLPSGSL